MTIELAKTAPMVRARTNNYGVGSVEGLRTSGVFYFEGEIGRDMPKDSFGKYYKDIHSQSIVLADQAVYGICICFLS